MNPSLVIVYPVSMANITDINAFWTVQTDRAWNNMIKDKREAGIAIPDSLLQVYSRMPNKRDIKRFVIEYLSPKCPITLEFLPPKPMNSNIKQMYDEMEKEERRRFKREYTTFTQTVPNYKVYVDLIDLYEYEVGMSHEQAVKAVENELKRSLIETKFIKNYTKALTLTSATQPINLSEALTLTSEGQPEPNTFYRYDPIVRKLNEIKEGRKLLDIEALPSLITRVSHNQTTTSGSANKTYDITNLKLYCQHLMEFSNLMIENEPLIICAYICKLTSSSLNLQIANLREELVQTRKEIKEEVRSSAKEVIDAYKDKQKLLTPSKEDKRLIILACYTPIRKDGSRRPLKDGVLFYIASRFERTSKDFLRDHRKSKNIYRYEGMTCCTTDEVQLMRELGFKDKKIGGGNSKKYLVNMDEFNDLRVALGTRCEKYTRKTFVDDDDDDDVSETRLITEDDMASCMSKFDDEEEETTTYYLVMLKDKEKDKEANAYLTWFKLLDVDDHEEEGYTKYQWEVSDENIIDSFKLELTDEEDGWKSCYLTSKEINVIKKKME